MLKKDKKSQKQDVVSFFVTSPPVITYHTLELFANQNGLQASELLEVAKNYKIIVFNHLDYPSLSTANSNTSDDIVQLLITTDDYSEIENTLSNLLVLPEDIKKICNLKVLLDEAAQLEKEKPTVKLSYGLQNYFNEVSSMPLLTPEEEKELTKKISEGDQKARNKLIERNLRLVIAVAKRYQNRGLGFADIIMEGNLGLMKAVKKFDYEKGNKFSTYAYCWIIQSITRAIADKSNIIRIPVHLHELKCKINKFSDHYYSETGIDPDFNVIAEELKIKPKKVQDVLNIKSVFLSIDQNLNSNESKTFGEIFLDDKKNFYDKLIKEERSSSLKKVIDLLPEREATILKLRYNLVDSAKSRKKNYTLDDIGRIMGITRERVRQLEQKALKMLQSYYKEHISNFNQDFSEDDN